MLEVNNLNYESANTDGNYKKYKSIGKVQAALDNKNAISVIITTDYSHFTCMNKNECVKILKKKIHKVRNKLAYHYWSLPDKEAIVPFPDTGKIWDYAILLPWYEIETPNNIVYNIIPTYTSITSLWMVLIRPPPPWGGTARPLSTSCGAPLTLVIAHNLSKLLRLP